MTVLTYQATALLNLDTGQLATSPNPAGQAEQFTTQRFIQMATDREVLSTASARPVEGGDVAGSEQEHPSPDSEAMRR